MYTIWASFDDRVLNEASKYTTETHAYYGQDSEVPNITCEGLQFAPEEHLSKIEIYGADKASKIERVVLYSSSTNNYVKEIGQSTRDIATATSITFDSGSSDPFNSFFGFESQNVTTLNTSGPEKTEAIATLGALTEDRACIDIYFDERVAARAYAKVLADEAAAEAAAEALKLKEG